jgi:hypothetical protein
MLIYYCSQHERLLDRQRHEWLDFSLEKMKKIKDLYAFFFPSTNPAFSDYRVIETRCSECDLMGRQP